MSGVLFSDTFELSTIDYDPVANKKDKKFDKVSRIDAKSENYDTELTLDINSEIYPMNEGDKFEIMLSDRLNETADSMDDTTGYDPTRELDSRAQKYEYIMHGKIFKYAEEKARAVVYTSYGGLLMALKGEARILTSHTFKVDSEIYLFMRKV